VGGNTHFIILVGGEDPEELLKSYHEYIGKAHIPPFWSMGYHQSRWGYRSLETVEKVVSLFQEYEIPLDTFWLDLDYMLNKKIFTVDEISYPPEDLNELMKAYNLRLVPLLDVGIATKDSQPVKLGKNMNIFLRSPSPLEYYYKGEVWPGEVYYVDFLHPNASAFWKTQLEKLQKKINFSGIWLDMNEPTNFKGGEITFEPFPVQKMENINTMTVSVDVPHHSSEGTPLSHASVHAYYGHLSAIPTFEFLQQKGRPFILTRSNSVGTGVFAAHWTGDNVANWEFLKSSINSNFLYQIFGIQMVGSDICGFYTNSNADLCSRWMQLGSFYPFARNHNHETAIPQEPYAFGANHLLTSVLSLRTRYALLKQLYSWLVISKGKGSFFRPLGFEFYED
jgi:alpha-glucosidase (family GH31 glycosyl hydrolase)